MENNRRFRTFFVYVNKWCPRRRIEVSKLCRYFAVNDLIAATNPKKADLIVRFTCGSFETNEKLSILTIEKSLREKSAKIVITGCLPKINPERLKIYDIALLISLRNLNTLDSMIGAKVPYNSLRSDATFIGGFHDSYQGHLVDRVKRNVKFSADSSNSRIFRYLLQVHQSGVFQKVRRHNVLSTNLRNQDCRELSWQLQLLRD